MKNKEELINSLTAELEALVSNLTKLTAFRKTKVYVDLHKEVKKDMETQEYHMKKYADVLKKRLNFIKNNY